MLGARYVYHVDSNMLSNVEEYHVFADFVEQFYTFLYIVKLCDI